MVDTASHPFACSVDLLPGVCCYKASLFHEKLLLLLFYYSSRLLTFLVSLSAIVMPDRTSPVAVVPVAIVPVAVVCITTPSHPIVSISSIPSSTMPILLPARARSLSISRFTSSIISAPIRSVKLPVWAQKRAGGKLFTAERGKVEHVSEQSLKQVPVIF